MNSKLDHLPGQCREFCQSKVKVDNETFKFFYRDIIACITQIYGHHNLVPYLKFKPECHYIDADMTFCMYGDIYTRKWWWEVQVSEATAYHISLLTLSQKAVEENTPGATIIPVFISTDKTLVTSFCGKKAYPVYVTIGNVPKEIRRKPTTNTYVLLGYLPVTDLEHMDGNTSHQCAVNNLFHTCMCQIL